MHYRGLALGHRQAGLDAGRRALQLAREVDNQALLIYIAQALTQLHLLQGNEDEVIASVRQSLDACARFGQPWFATFDFYWILPTLYARGEIRTCATLAGFIEHWPVNIPRIAPLAAAAFDGSRAALGDTEFTLLSARGRGLTLDEMTREVRAALTPHVAALDA
jgi:hypothetical protein